MSEKLTNEQIIDKARLSGLSMDVIGDTQAKLKAIFPQCFKEGKLDIDQLLNECGEWIDNDFERYKFEWHGKVESIRHSQRRSSGCLRPYKEESVDWDNTENLYIEGDNLEVLKLLQSAYYKKVKMIYIDPPYNTGNDFIYEDDYTDSLKAYLEMTDQQSSNPETSGRFHTKWLNMMYPRLRLASNLLRDDGVIFVSIDDNEVTNLRKLMDEVFGEENFEADIIVVSNPGGRDYKQVAITHEHILIYSKSDALELNELPAPAEYKFTDSQGGYNTRELRNRNPKFHSGNRPNLFYPFYVNPNSADKDGYCAVSLEKSAEYSIEVSPYNSVGKESVWRWGKAKASENIIMGDNDGSQILAKQKKDGDWNIYEKNRRSTTKVKSLWNETEMRTEDGTRLIRALFDNDTPFDHPKPLDLVKRCIRIGSSENDIILDFFSGSATTSHAVMQLNATDKGKRKFIMVQMAGKTNNAEYPTICEIGKERIRRAGENIKKTVGKINMQRRLEELSLSEKPKGLIFEKAYKEVTDFSSEMYDTEDLDTGFKVFKLDTSCIKIWDGQRATPHDLMFKFHDIIDSVKDDRTPTEVVYELALKLGVPLDMKIQTQEIMGKTIYSVENGLIMFCLANDITSDLVDKMCDNEPATIILSESGMASDTDLSNAYYICHDKGIELKLV